MKKLRAAGARLRGVIRARRAYLAVVPLAIVLVLALGEPPSPETAPPRFDKPPIDFRSAELAAIPLPAHVGYLSIEPGDTLDVLLEACGLDRSDANALVAAFARKIDPRTLKPGQLLRYERDGRGVTRQVELLVRGRGSLRGSRGSDGTAFEVEEVEAPELRAEVVLTAEIETSLWDALMRTGESPALASELADVFQWDIDFFRLQPGDWFSFVVEKRWIGAEFVGYGPIAAVRFDHRSETYEAFHFERAGGFGGYYTSSGTPMRKQFLKSPLKFSRVTSGYTHRRFHPILKRFRPHLGVDYGAPIGTPVMCTADGVISFAGRGSGEGNWIRVRHGSKIETAYLHLSRFAPGIRPGVKVRQGQVIGYVGATGLATAPHLDYRVRENGRWINPKTLRSITADPLRGGSLREFETVVAEVLPKLTAKEQWAAGK